SKLSETVTRIEDFDGVDYVSASADIASTLVDIKRGVTAAGVFIVAILGMVSVIIISNTIKVTIFNRRKEISIMKYVGATDMFIRIPFLVEGVLIGLTSAILAYGFLWLGYEYIMDWLAKTQSSWLMIAYQNLVPFADVSVMILLGFTAAGGAFGILGSLFFVNKYLKV
ncbi:MAG: FtsX-like permease family protein, partial [Angelakisella sp.]